MKNNGKTIIICALFCLCAHLFASEINISDDPNPNPDPGAAAAATTTLIREIEIRGNATTKPKIFKAFLEFKEGELYDSSKIHSARTNLWMTHLYEEVDIVADMREDGAYITVAVKEAVRLKLNWGGSYSTTKHGAEDLWITLRGGASMYNLGGRLEELSFEAKVWELKGINAIWTKPFVSTPYFIKAGIGIEAYPDEFLPLDFIDFFAKISGGVTIGKRSQLALNAKPVYQHNRIAELMVDSTRLDDGDIPNKREIYETFAGLTLTSDFRNTRFDTRKGWHNTLDISTNYLHDGGFTPFFEFVNDFKLYLPLFFDNVMTLRLYLTTRNTKADAYHRLTYGGTGSMRGYHDKSLGIGRGLDNIINSSHFASLRYNVPVWQTPPLKIPFVKDVYKSVDLVSIRLDAAFIVDYLLLYHEPWGALLKSIEPREKDIGIGFGARIVFLEIRQSGCVDLVYGRRPRADLSRFDWKPMVHFSLERDF